MDRMKKINIYKRVIRLTGVNPKKHSYLLFCLIPDNSKI